MGLIFSKIISLRGCSRKCVVLPFCSFPATQFPPVSAGCAAMAPGLDTFGDYFMAAQALSVRGDHGESDTDGEETVCSV